VTYRCDDWGKHFIGEAMTEPSEDLEKLSAFLSKEFELILYDMDELPVKPEDAVRVAILLLEQLCLMMP